MAAAGGGCSLPLSTKSSPATGELSAQVNVHDEALTLRLASPRTPVPASTPLVVYASGDGGWFGAAVGMFHTIADNGFPTVGFSTKAFMRIGQRWSRPLSVKHVAEGYQRIIDAARARLRLPPDAPVVLTGWSRGASLSVLVASSREVDPHVIGLVAVGLAADEQLDIAGDSADDVGVVSRGLPRRWSTRLTGCLLTRKTGDDVVDRNSVSWTTDQLVATDPGSTTCQLVRVQGGEPAP
jgi:hypothetical protein